MAIEILTALLVGITAYYAWQNRAMVLEMRRARAAQLVPKLVLTLRFLGGGNCFPRLINVGLGPALDVDIEIRLEPDGPLRHWVTAVVPSGQGHDFYIQESGINLGAADQLVDRYPRLRLKGSYNDALGDAIVVNDVADVREMWNLSKSAGLLQENDDGATRALKEVRRELQMITGAIKKAGRT